MTVGVGTVTAKRGTKNVPVKSRQISQYHSASAAAARAQRQRAQQRRAQRQRARAAASSAAAASAVSAAAGAGIVEAEHSRATCSELRGRVVRHADCFQELVDAAVADRNELDDLVTP